MSVSDPISDMLTRIRNALTRNKETVAVPFSKYKFSILEAFKREGYISRIEIEGEGVSKKLVVALKYGESGEKVITQLIRESKPSRKIYKGTKDLTPVRSGFGSSFVSTSNGILSDRECREQFVGGELVCTLW
ncbi:MAG: 30S ribosomal protein S8 [Planctomycetota bacterium]|nr:MAG: 30S ribosomal protein S8 [Planctomycetota bacterium]